MAKKIKKPRYKALPKAPKASASVETWRRYEQKVNAVVSENLKKKAEYDKKVAAQKNVAKIKDDIKNKIANAKSKVPFGSRKRA